MKVEFNNVEAGYTPFQSNTWYFVKHKTLGYVYAVYINSQEDNEKYGVWYFAENKHAVPSYSKFSYFVSEYQLISEIKSISFGA